MNKQDLILIGVVVIIATMFALALFNIASVKQDTLNTYNDCVSEQNVERLPAEVAWEVYADICR